MCSEKFPRGSEHLHSAVRSGEEDKCVQYKTEECVPGKVHHKEAGDHNRERH